MPDKTTKQSDSLKPVSDALLSDEEILTQYLLTPMERLQATINFAHRVRKHKIQDGTQDGDIALCFEQAKKTIAKLISRGWVKPQDIISAEQFKAVLNKVGWKSSEEVEALLVEESARVLGEIEHNFSATNVHVPESGRKPQNTIDVDVWNNLKQGKEKK